MLRLVLICVGIAGVLVIVVIPVLAACAMAHDDDARRPGDLD